MLNCEALGITELDDPAMTQVEGGAAGALAAFALGVAAYYVITRYVMN